MAGAMPSLPPSSASLAPSAIAAPAVPGIWRRMAAWMYEGMLLFAVVFVAGWLFSALSQMRHALDDRRILLQAFLFIVFGIYFVGFWSRGQTLAMKTWGMRLVGRDGAAVPQWRALLRYFLAWLWFLPPLVVARALPFPVSGAELGVLCLGWVAIWAVLARFHPERQFWHDAWAGTRLISTRPR